jgi:hypothetical protein
VASPLPDVVKSALALDRPSQRVQDAGNVDLVQRPQLDGLQG